MFFIRNNIQCCLAYNKNISSITKVSSNKNDEEFAHYLAGYIEGDGSLYTPKSLKNKNNKSLVCSIEIIFHISDLEFAKLLQKRIKHGNLYLSKKNQTVRLMIQNLDGVLSVIHLINGKMRTPKIYKLHLMIEWLKIYKSINIDKQGLDLSPLGSNSWLSGFIDTDGSFNIKGFTNNIKTYPAFQFYIPQRKVNELGHSYESIMNKIADFLNVRLKSRYINGYPQFTVTSSKFLSNQCLIYYLNIYPLFTSKYLNYIDWVKGNKLFYTNCNVKGLVRGDLLEEIRKLKLGMNLKRKTYSWDHLSKFY